jgi:hypothetical protein
VSVALAGLVKIELPSATIRLCDGGRIVWGAEVYRARDADFGMIAGVQSLSEGGGDELAPLQMTLATPSGAAAADLVVPAFQGSRVRFWQAVFDVATGEVTGDPVLKFDGLLDQARLSFDGSLTTTVIAQAARLFEMNTGNSLSPGFHKSVWSGETGHDNATGIGRAVAWGVTAPPAPVTPGTSGAYDFGGIPGLPYV